MSLVGGLECRRVFVVFLIYARYLFHTAHLGPRALSRFLPLPQQWATTACYLGQGSWEGGRVEGGLVPSLLLQPQFLVRACMPELQERAFLSVPVSLITVFRICMSNFDNILFLLHGCDKLFYIFKHKCSISYCNICIVLVVFFCRFLFLLTHYSWLFPCSGF